MLNEPGRFCARQVRSTYYMYVCVCVCVLMIFAIKSTTVV